MRAGSPPTVQTFAANRSEELEEVWHDGWRGYASFVYENEQTVVHSEEFVTDDGAHINRVECLWSLLNS